jgi:hypothetical protein
MAKRQYRQGDVLITQIRARDLAALTRVDAGNGRIVLAFGEATGHAHALCSATAELYEGSSGDRFLRLTTPATLEHDEHAPIALPVGFFEVVVQREYDPEAIRRVAD